MPLIELVAPDPAWPAQFADIEWELDAVFGSTALRIDHIGSTSVPGLAAKDIIDVQVTVASLDPTIVDAMVDA
ncbi:MAG: GrpB family protein, partial [Acidimicrobiales bacterium]